MKIPLKTEDPGGAPPADGGDADASYDLANLLDFLGFPGAADVAQGQGDSALEGEGNA